jgi:hypothetical protein
VVIWQRSVFVGENNMNAVRLAANFVVYIGLAFGLLYVSGLDFMTVLWIDVVVGCLVGFNFSIGKAIGKNG